MNVFIDVVVILAGIAGLVALGFVVVYFFGFVDWMNRGSH